MTMTSLWLGRGALLLINVALVMALSEDGNVDVKVVQTLPLSSSLRCNNLMPGLGRMVRGVDLARLDLLPINLNADMGYRSPIFDYTCKEGNKIHLGGALYDLPDQIIGAESVPGGLTSTNVEVFEDMDEVTTTMGLSVGIEYTPGAFTLTPSFNFAHTTFSNSSRYMEEVQAHVAAFRADHIPFWAMDLTKYAQMYLDRRLKKSFHEAPELYQVFIQTYGTHFFQDALVGGILKLFIQTETSYFKEDTTVGIGLQATGTFGKMVKLKDGNASVSHTDVSKRFLNASRTTMRYYGGSLNLLDDAGFKGWMPTIIKDPWLFRGNLKPIYELILDESKKREMKLAVQVHLDKAYLVFLRKTIETTVAIHGSTSATKEWMAMVQAESVKTIPDHNRIRSIGNDIEHHLVIPEWFQNNVELCFEWAPTQGFAHDPSQCAANQKGLPRKLCSKFGQFTKEYMDDTDMKIGGCYYRWSLQVKGNPGGIPGYFWNTKICHRWHAEADAGQCNNGVSDGMNCAKVGESTAQYLDDTNFRTGGCEYSWSILTPNDAPTWLKNLQLCMKWRATGDPQQCGNNGAPATICAKTNQWSSPYNDDTSARGGGCMMSWGMRQ